VPAAPTRRLPVSDGLVALRSRHVDIWLVWLVVGNSCSCFRPASLLSWCVCTPYLDAGIEGMLTWSISSHAHPTSSIRYWAERNHLTITHITHLSTYTCISVDTPKSRTCCATAHMEYIPKAIDNQCLLGGRDYMIRLFQRLWLRTTIHLEEKGIQRELYMKPK
jgi:hypothetical protein